MSQLYYDRQGNPLQASQWLYRTQSPDEYLIAETTCADGTVVKTIWLGIDQLQARPELQSDPLGAIPKAPLIFKTMMTRNGLEIGAVLYASEADAITGHAEVVARYGGEQTKGPEEFDAREFAREFFWSDLPEWLQEALTKMCARAYKAGRGA